MVVLPLCYNSEAPHTSWCWEMDPEDNTALEKEIKIDTKLEKVLNLYRNREKSLLWKKMLKAIKKQKMVPLSEIYKL